MSRRPASRVAPGAPVLGTASSGAAPDAASDIGPAIGDSRRSIAVVLVHYHGPELVRRAWEALGRDGSGAGFRLEGVVVDNGSTEAERALLRTCGPRLVEPGINLGYAGGANRGMGETRSELAVLLNPDVQVLPGCLAALVEALDAGAAVAGPTFFWDRADGFRLPPTEARSRFDELVRLLARRPSFAALGRRRWRRHAQRFWTAREPRAAIDLSGALLAFHRSAWREIPFDDGFPLYFEETDWLRRLDGSGRRIVQVPEARALHAYAQSTRHEPRAAEWFRISERRFRRRHYGRVFSRILDLLGRLWPPGEASSLPSPGSQTSAAEITGPGPLPGLAAAGGARDSQPGRSDSERLPAMGAPAVAWLELSPALSGFPAAGRRVEARADLELSTELWQSLAPGRYWLRALDASNRTLATWPVVRGEGAA